MKVGARHVRPFHLHRRSDARNGERHRPIVDGDDHARIHLPSGVPAGSATGGDSVAAAAGSADAVAALRRGARALGEAEPPSTASARTIRAAAAAAMPASGPRSRAAWPSAGGAAIGTLKHLPPTLLAQYHFDAPGFKPYVGAGLNYTRFSSVNLPAGVSIDRNSFGPALQVGVDIPLAKNLYLNFDVKKVFIKTDVSAGGAKLGTFKVDPVLVGVGLGWRF